MYKLNLMVLTLLFIMSVTAAAPRELKQAKIKRDDYSPDSGKKHKHSKLPPTPTPTPTYIYPAYTPYYQPPDN
jgi:hypothetical protein